MHPTHDDTLAFAWDRKLTGDEVRAALADPSNPDRIAIATLLLREARPGVVWRYVTPQQLDQLFPELAPHLGRQRAFWTWLLEHWRSNGRLQRAH